MDGVLVTMAICANCVHFRWDDDPADPDAGRCDCADRAVSAWDSCEEFVFGPA